MSVVQPNACLVGYGQSSWPITLNGNNEQSNVASHIIISHHFATTILSPEYCMYIPYAVLRQHKLHKVQMFEQLFSLELIGLIDLAMFPPNKNNAKLHVLPVWKLKLWCKSPFMSVLFYIAYVLFENFGNINVKKSCKDNYKNYFWNSTRIRYPWMHHRRRLNVL